MPWKATGKSVIGTLHQKYNLPCQDYNDYNFLHQSEFIVGAVADGAGSAKYAEDGAKITVETFITQITQRLQELSSGTKFFLDLLESDQNQIDLFCSTLIQEVQQKLVEKAQELNCSLKDFACTLIAFIASPEGMLALQIGDGFLVTRAEEETGYCLVFQPDKGEFANETTFVTSKLAQETMHVKVLKQKTVFICAATDGLERVAIRFQGWEPFAPFFQPLESFMVNYLREVATEVRETNQVTSDKNTGAVESEIDSQNQTDSENTTTTEQQIQAQEQDIPEQEEQEVSGEQELKDISNQNNQESAEIQNSDSENTTTTEQQIQAQEQDIPDQKEQEVSEELELNNISHQNNQESAEIQHLEDTQSQHKKLSYLEKFLSSSRLNAHTNDDKTLLLCLYQFSSENYDR